MRKLLGALVFGSMCLVLTLGNTGCTPANKGKAFTLVGDKDLSLDKKDGEKLTITVKHGKIESVTIDPKEKGVTAEKDTDTTAKVSIGKAADTVESYTIKIKGKGEDGKEKEHSVTLKIKAATPAEKKELALESDKDIKLDRKKGEKAIISVKGGKVESVSIDPKEKGVEAKKDGDTSAKVWVDDADKTVDTAYTVTIKGKGEDGKEKELTVKVMVAKKEEKKAAEEIKLNTGEKAVEVAQGGDATVKIISGKIKGATASEESKLTFEMDKESIKIKAAKDAKVGEYDVTVTSSEEGGKDVKFKVKVIAPKKGGALDQQNPLQPNNSRQFTGIKTTERFLTLNRRLVLTVA